MQKFLFLPSLGEKRSLLRVDTFLLPSLGVNVIYLAQEWFSLPSLGDTRSFLSAETSLIVQIAKKCFLLW